MRYTKKNKINPFNKEMPCSMMRFSWKDPHGKVHVKSVSLSKYTHEEAVYVGKVWKECKMKGIPFEMPIFDKKPPPADIVKDSKALLPFRSMDTIELPENGGVSFAMIGSTRSGKTTAMLHVFKKYFKKHLTFLMTHSSHSQIYTPLKKAVICNGFYPSLLKDGMKYNQYTKNSMPMCWIFDDLATDGKTSKDMTKLLTIGRNSGMSVILTGQKMNMLNATGRSNVNYVCLFRQNTSTAIEDVIKTYLRPYLPRSCSILDMIEIYKSLTEDHHFIVIDTLNDEAFLTRVDSEEF